MLLHVHQNHSLVQSVTGHRIFRILWYASRRWPEPSSAVNRPSFLLACDQWSSRLTPRFLSKQAVSVRCVHGSMCPWHDVSTVRCVHGPITLQFWLEFRVVRDDWFVGRCNNSSTFGADRSTANQPTPTGRCLHGLMRPRPSAVSKALARRAHVAL